MQTREQLQQEMTINEMVIQKMKDNISDLKAEKYKLEVRMAQIQNRIERKERIKLRNQTINKYIAEYLL